MKHPRFLFLTVVAAVVHLAGAAPAPVASQTKSPASAPPSVAMESEPRRMEVAFVLDTTGSMSGMIAAAKQKIWAIASKLKSAEPTPLIRFGLVAYRDRGDAFVTKVSPLTEDLDDIYQQLFGFQAGGGGDTPESVNAALHAAVRELQWSTDPRILRVIFLVGDAPPHMDYANDVKYPESCGLAKSAGVVVNTLQCGADPDTKRVWQEIAGLTGGSYAALSQDGGSIRIATTQDGEIVRLSTALDATIVPYGSSAERANLARNRELLKRMSSEGVADRSSFLGRAEAGAVMSGKGDLVLEVMSDRFQLSSIEPEKLEPQWRNLFAAEREDLILRLVEQRRALQQELAAVLKARDAEMAEKLAALADRRDVLELSAFQVLETQAGEKGFIFKKTP
jgi:Mg-chelatase subunit ChlD